MCTCVCVVSLGNMWFGGKVLEIPLCPPNHMFPNFPLGFMGLVHESITYIFSNKINYLVEDFMSLEVLVMVSLSCDQNLGKKGTYCPLAFRCQPLVLFMSELAVG